MNIHIPFTEIQSLLLTKTHQEVGMSCTDERTLAVSKTVTFLGFSKEIRMNLSVQEVADSRILLSHDNPVLIKSVVELAKFLSPKINELVEAPSSSTVALYLDKVEQLQKVFEKVTLQNICFQTDGADIYFSLKQQ